MSTGQISIKEVHCLMEMLRSIDVGLILIDKDYKVSLWNNFMENHSGIKSSEINGQNIIDFVPDESRDWLLKKLVTVTTLMTRAFSTWEQQPYLFRFGSYHPITGIAEHMYQNISFIPIPSTDGKLDQIGLIIYDVTDIAINKKQLLSANKELSLISRTDALTQLHNRGYWEERIAQEFQRYQRTRQTCSLLMFDIDHFKKVNDTYGHQAGDEVIRMTALNIKNIIRKTDIAGRYGGEEFAVILVDTNAENAMTVAEKLRTGIESLRVPCNGTEIRWTISVGIAECSTDISNYATWIELSDQALYQAKENGRNNCVVYQPAKPSKRRTG